MDITTIVIGIVGLALLYLFLTYNSLVMAKVRVEQSFKDIDVQLKKRFDLLPDLVETAKKAAGLDERIFTEVARLRADSQKAQEQGNLGERARVEGQISSLMRDVKVAVEAYPDIKSHGELSNLMESVTAIEEKIAYARQFYNSNTADYNTKLRVFPNVLVASTLGFKEAEYFNAPEDEKKDIKVTF